MARRRRNTRRRKDKSPFDDLHDMLLDVPVWVGPSLALLVFLVLRFFIPAIVGSSEKPGINSVIGGTVRGFAWLGASIVLFVWLLAEFQKWRRRRFPDAQSGLDSILDLSWQDFEHLVGEAYRRQGYTVQETGSPGGDGGIDLSMRRAGEYVLVQCKRWRRKNVGVGPVRELFGVMTSESATRGILVTCGSFTPAARSFAEGKPLDLVDGPQLWELVRSVQTASPPSVPDNSPMRTQPEAFAPTASAAGRSPRCPNCGDTMVRRVAKKGPNPGSPFWGCSRFPQCRGTRQHSR